jgi:uridine kinase
MKTSFEKFMASSAVQSVELGAVKVDLAMDVNAIMKAADQFIFEDMKVQSKAISALNDAQKALKSANQDPKPLLAEFENALKQMATLGVEPPRAFANSYASFKKDTSKEAKIKSQVLAKLFEIDKIFGGSGI